MDKNRDNSNYDERSMRANPKEPLNRELLEYKLNEITLRLDSIDIKLESRFVTMNQHNADILRLSQRIDGQWKIFIFVGSAIGVALIAALMKLLLS